MNSLSGVVNTRSKWAQRRQEQMGYLSNEDRKLAASELHEADVAEQRLKEEEEMDMINRKTALADAKEKFQSYVNQGKVKPTYW